MTPFFGRSYIRGAASGAGFLEFLPAEIRRNGRITKDCQGVTEGAGCVPGEGVVYARRFH